jgi:AsmA-like C-terminal region
VSINRRRALQMAAVASAVVVAVIPISWMYISRHLSQLIASGLSRQYNGSVEFSDFRAVVNFPRLECEIDGLTVRFHGRQDLPPMIAMRRLTVKASMWGLLRVPARIRFVNIEGLQLNVPPRNGNDGGQGTRNFMRRSRQVHFDEIRADGAVLTILPRLPWKPSHEFDIGQLNLSSIGSDGTLRFRAKLTNPSPPGQITSSGTFGPWNIEKPSLTPVSGAYVFENANLGVFNGIAGILSSDGRYGGVLEKIDVEGTTDVPDFQVTQAGHPIHLETTFDATVDGTDGNTYLHPVVAHFGKTELVAQGKIERAQGTPGRAVTLDVSVDKGRIEDLLLLTVKEKPPMTGPVRLKTSFAVTPGQKNILDRLALDSSIEMDSMHFTNPAAQQRLDNMSARSKGAPREVKNPAEATGDDDVVAKMQGKFRLQEGLLAISRVHFQIPGAEMQISGQYALAGEEMDLHGTLKMQAALSHTTTGIKSALLRIADPFFSKNGHTELPVKITGSVRHPHYALDLRHKEDKTAHMEK